MPPGVVLSKKKKKSKAGKSKTGKVNNKAKKSGKSSKTGNKNSSGKNTRPVKTEKVPKAIEDTEVILTEAAPVEDKAADPWDYPIKHLPEEVRFAEWRGDTVSAGRLIPGGRKKDFRFRLFAGGEMLLDDEGMLSEELYMPAMRGLKTVGGDR